MQVFFAPNPLVQLVHGKSVNFLEQFLEQNRSSDAALSAAAPSQTKARVSLASGPVQSGLHG